MADAGFTLERYRSYLHMLARGRLHGDAGVVDASDVVHEALLRAHRHREQFRGHTEAEWCGWLRQILANALADAFRKRPAERGFLDDLNQSHSRFEALLPCGDTTPSQNAQRKEQLLKLADAMTTLTADERTAIELRHLAVPRWSIESIAQHLNRPTPKAVARLLERGLHKLRVALVEE